MSIHATFVSKVFALAALATAACSAAAHAANIRYISAAGSNANACTLAAPCRTLQRGINRTPAGGELRVLDSGFFGAAATITKTMTIIGNGATISKGAITVDGAGAMVVLRGLVLNGWGADTTGISIARAAAVHIERCVIHGFTQHGIETQNGIEDGVAVFVLDSISRHNGGVGLFINPGASRTTVDNSRFESNGGGGVRIHDGHATISRSIASSNGEIGIVTFAPVTVTSTMAVQNNNIGFSVGFDTMTLESSVAHGNNIGLNVSGGNARISRSTFTGNTTGIDIPNGVVETLGNNTIRGNMTDIDGTLTPIDGK
jgi:hypothetical protein